MGWSSPTGWNGPGWSRAASGVWTPLQFPGLLAWFEGDHGVLTSSGQVTGWADQSGNGNNIGGTTPPNPNYPDYGINTLNGKNVVTFRRASGTGLISPSANFPVGGGTTLCAFAVFRYTPSTANDTTVAFCASGQSADWNNTPSCIFMQQSSDTNMASSRNYPSGVANQTTSTNTWMVGGCVFDGTNVTEYLNNAAGIPVASTGNFGSVGTLGIGCEASTGAPSGLDGDIAAVIISNAVPSSSDRANLHSYWNTKWGV